MLHIVNENETAAERLEPVTSSRAAQRSMMHPSLGTATTRFERLKGEIAAPKSEQSRAMSGPF